MEQPSDGLLQDTGSPSAAGRFRPYASAKHRVTRGRYITSNDRRGYIPVYEYPLNGQWIMMDIDDGYILWTGIWKALGNAKADIVKMLESQPDLAPQLRRVRGGYLKIQGTWMPYEVALRLARRVAWTIREDLIPLFGPTFPSTCLSPDQPGYGQILGSQPGKRRGRRAAVPLPLPATLPPPRPSDSDASPGDRGQQTRQPGPSLLPPFPSQATEGYHPHPLSSSRIAGPSSLRQEEFHDRGRYSGDASGVAQHSHTGWPLQYHVRSPTSAAPLSDHKQYVQPTSEGRHAFIPSSGHVQEAATDAIIHNTRDRFPPYQNAAHTHHHFGVLSGATIHRPSPIDLPPLTIPSQPHSDLIGDNGPQSVDLPSMHVDTDMRASAPRRNHPQGSPGELITLPSIGIRSPDDIGSDASHRRPQGSSGYSLPPISALSNLPPPPSDGNSSYRFDSAAVLRRLALDDKEVGETRRFSFISASDGLERTHRDVDDNSSDIIERPTQRQLLKRRRSLSDPLLHPDELSRSQHRGLAAPDISVGSTSDVTVSRRPHLSSLSPTDSTRLEVRRTDMRDSSEQRRRSFLLHRKELRPRSRQDYRNVNARVEDDDGPSTASLSRLGRSDNMYNMEVTGPLSERSVMTERQRTEMTRRQTISNTPTEPSRLRAHSRASTPVGQHHVQMQPPYVQSHPLQQTTAGSPPHFSMEIPHSQRDASPPSYSGGRRARGDGTPTSGFHSSLSR